MPYRDFRAAPGVLEIADYHRSSRRAFMKRIAAVLSSVALIASAATIVAAQENAIEDPIEARQEFMKQNGRLLGALGPMAKGEQPFNAEEARALLEAFSAHSQTFEVDAYFPEDSQEGDTRAAPAIWENFEEFREHAEEFKADAAAAAEAELPDVQALQAQMAAIGENCSSCHEEYRLPEE
jgi:cytochrome c556